MLFALCLFAILLLVFHIGKLLAEPAPAGRFLLLRIERFPPQGLHGDGHDPLPVRLLARVRR